MNYGKIKWKIEIGYCVFYELEYVGVIEELIIGWLLFLVWVLLL